MFFGILLTYFKFDAAIHKHLVMLLITANSETILIKCVNISYSLCLIHLQLFIFVMPVLYLNNKYNRLMHILIYYT